MKMEFTVCVGSCCYSKGAQEIIDFIRSEYPETEVTGAFCLENCSQGVSIKVNGVIKHIKNTDEINQVMQVMKELE